MSSHYRSPHALTPTVATADIAAPVLNDCTRVACSGLNTLTSKSVDADTTRPCYPSHAPHAPTAFDTTVFTQSEWLTNSWISIGTRMSFEMSNTYTSRPLAASTFTQLLSLATAISGILGFIAVHITASCYASRALVAPTTNSTLELISVSLATTCSVSVSVKPFSSSSKLAYPSHLPNSTTSVRSPSIFSSLVMLPSL